MRTIADLIAAIAQLPPSSKTATLAKKIALEIATSGLVREDWGLVLDQVHVLVSDLEVMMGDGAGVQSRT